MEFLNKKIHHLLLFNLILEKLVTEGGVKTIYNQAIEIMLL